MTRIEIIKWWFRWVVVVNRRRDKNSYNNKNSRSRSIFIFHSWPWQTINYIISQIKCLSRQQMWITSLSVENLMVVFAFFLLDKFSHPLLIIETNLFWTISSISHMIFVCIFPSDISTEIFPRNSSRKWNQNWLEFHIW